MSENRYVRFYRTHQSLWNVNRSARLVEFRKLFIEQVKFDYSSIGEIAGNLAADNIVATARQDLGGFQTTQHLITNHLIKIENDTATAKAHVRAIHLLPNEEKDP